MEEGGKRKERKNLMEEIKRCKNAADMGGKIMREVVGEEEEVHHYHHRHHDLGKNGAVVVSLHLLN
jgi:hypothetical protein